MSPTYPAPLAARLPTRAWQRSVAAAGVQGQHYYGWTLITITSVATATTGSWCMLTRRVYVCRSAETLIAMATRTEADSAHA